MHAAVWKANGDANTGVFSPHKPSHELQPAEFDNILGINCRGLWLCAREELKCMMGQEPLSTHDGRPGCRGSVVNIASNLAIVSKPGTRKSYYLQNSSITYYIRLTYISCKRRTMPPKLRFLV